MVYIPTFSVLSIQYTTESFRKCEELIWSLLRLQINVYATRPTIPRCRRMFQMWTISAMIKTISMPLEV